MSESASQGSVKPVNISSTSLSSEEENIPKIEITSNRWQ